MRSAGMPLSNRKRLSVVVGLRAARSGPKYSGSLSASLACSARRAACISCSALSSAAALSAWPRRSASASSASSSWRCCIRRWTPSGSFSASAFQSTPDHLSATALRKAGPFSCHHFAACSTVALAALATFIASCARLRGILRLLLGIGDALPLVLVQHRAQVFRHVAPARLVLGAPEIRGLVRQASASASEFGPARSRARLSLALLLRAPPGSLAAALLFRRLVDLGVRHQGSGLANVDGLRRAGVGFSGHGSPPSGCRAVPCGARRPRAPRPGRRGPAFSSVATRARL